MNEGYSFTIMELAEEVLKNSLLRHGQKTYDVAQRRFEFFLKEIENDEN